MTMNSTSPTSLFAPVSGVRREAETVPCKWCGKATTMLGTKECDEHWELRSRIERDPTMAKQMLAVLVR